MVVVVVVLFVCLFCCCFFVSASMSPCVISVNLYFYTKKLVGYRREERSQSLDFNALLTALGHLRAIKKKKKLS